jgi:hypothetical protein
MNRRLAAILFIFALATNTAVAADFGVVDADTGRPGLKMNGAIEAGDAEKLIALVLGLTAKGNIDGIPNRLVLDSRGGSVYEAEKIATVVELLRLSTSVRDSFLAKGSPGVCASACFFVWLAGYERSAGGRLLPTGDSKLDQMSAEMQKRQGQVGVHRPYFELNESSYRDMSEAQAKQRQAMMNVQVYLQTRNVPVDIINKMMARSSKDIYWLSAKETVSLWRSPEYEELLASNCDYRSTIINGESSNSQIQDYLVANSVSALQKLISCSRSLTLRLRRKELPPAFARMSNGWRPWS